MVRQSADAWDGTAFIRTGALHPYVNHAVTVAQCLWMLRIPQLVGLHLPGWQWFALWFVMPYGVGAYILSVKLFTRFWVERWTICPGAFTALFSLFGLGPDRHIDPDDIVQVELRIQTRRLWGSAWAQEGDQT